MDSIIRNISMENINTVNYQKILIIQLSAKKLEVVLREQEISTIAVYGMGYVGQKLVEALAERKINVSYGIDKNSVNFIANIPVYKPTEIEHDVDLILVTPEVYFEEIKNELSCHTKAKVIRLSEFLDEVLVFACKYESV